jgi:hypothetical protein
MNPSGQCRAPAIGHSLPTKFVTVLAEGYGGSTDSSVRPREKEGDMPIGNRRQELSTMAGKSFPRLSHSANRGSNI